MIAGLMLTTEAMIAKFLPFAFLLFTFRQGRMPSSEAAKTI